MTTAAIGRGVVFPIPEAGDVIHGHNIQVHIQFFKDTDAVPAVYVLLNNGQLTSEGFCGLKIFLNGRSLSKLRHMFQDNELLFVLDGVVMVQNCNIKLLKFSESSAYGELL